jgi:hypothetical protein
MHDVRGTGGDSRVRSGLPESGSGEESGDRDGALPGVDEEGAEGTLPVKVVPLKPRRYRLREHRSRPRFDPVLVGQRYGKRVVVELDEPTQRAYMHCDCGHLGWADCWELKNGAALACRRCCKSGRPKADADPSKKLRYEDDVECQVAVQHFLAHFGRGMTPIEIAKFDGITVQRVRQILASALTKYLQGARLSPDMADALELMDERTDDDASGMSSAGLYWGASE